MMLWFRALSGLVGHSSSVFTSVCVCVQPASVEEDVDGLPPAAAVGSLGHSKEFHPPRVAEELVDVVTGLVDLSRNAPTAEAQKVMHRQNSGHRKSVPPTRTLHMHAHVLKRLRAGGVDGQHSGHLAPAKLVTRVAYIAEVPKAGGRASFLALKSLCGLVLLCDVCSIHQMYPGYPSPKVVS